MLRKRIKRYVEEAVRNGSLSCYQAEVVMSTPYAKDLVRLHRSAGFSRDESVERAVRMALDCYALGLFPAKEAF